MPSLEFTELAARWGKFSRYVNKIGVAIRSNQGWVLQYGFTAFSPFPINIDKFHIKTDSIFACREISEWNDDQAINRINASLADTATIEFGGEVFELPGRGYNTFTGYDPLHLPRMPGPQRLPSLTSTRNGIENYEYPRLDVLELELKSHSIPFDNLTELFVELGQPLLAQNLASWSSQRTEIIIAPPISLESVQLNNGELICIVKASCLVNRDLVSIAMKLFPVKSEKVHRVPFEGDITWQLQRDTLLGRFVMRTPDIGLAQVFIRYAGEYVGSWWIRDSSVSFSKRYALHKSIDDAGFFVQKFFEDRNSFEERVSVMLSLLGLDCLFYGRIADLKDGPDILASSADGHLYVVECSTGDINSRGKLRRLYERTNRIREILEKSHFKPREILPVAITSVPHHETLHCIDELQNYGIAIVAREEVENLLRQIEAPPTPEQLFAAAMAAVPKPAALSQGRQA